MKDYNHIDELIRKKFEGFEASPPDSVWERVKGQIGPEPSSPKGNPITLPIITGLIILVGLIGMLFLISRMESTMNVQASSSQGYNDNAIQTALLKTNKQVADASFALDNEPSSSIQQDASDQALNSNIPVRKPFDGNSPYIESSSEDHHSNAPYILKNSHKSDRTRLERFNTEGYRMQGKTFDGTLDPASYANDGVTPRQSAPAGEEDYVRPTKPIFSIGFHFNPEVSLYPDDNISNALDYSFQIMPRINFNQWYLQSGVGIRTGGDRGNYQINYNKYLGSYEDVYDITFDSTENGVIPTFYTQTVDVYDTVPYYSITEAKARYTYLDVPLMLGYQWKFNRVSLFVNAGPSLSILLNHSNPSGDLPQENIRILNESSQIPAREQMNWQLMAGAGFSYSFSDKVSLSLEPSFRYYMTNGYKNNDVNTRHPYSFGVRAGIIYHFNH